MAHERERSRPVALRRLWLTSLQCILQWDRNILHVRLAYLCISRRCLITSEEFCIFYKSIFLVVTGCYDASAASRTNIFIVIFFYSLAPGVIKGCGLCKVEDNSNAAQADFALTVVLDLPKGCVKLSPGWCVWRIECQCVTSMMLRWNTLPVAPLTVSRSCTLPCAWYYAFTLGKWFVEIFVIVLYITKAYLYKWTNSEMTFKLC